MSLGWICGYLRSVFTNITFSWRLMVVRGRVMGIGITLWTGHSHLVKSADCCDYSLGLELDIVNCQTCHHIEPHGRHLFGRLKQQLTNHPPTHHYHQASVHVSNHQAFLLTWFHCMVKWTAFLFAAFSIFFLLDMKSLFMIINQEAISKLHLYAKEKPVSLMESHRVY